ncbi:hypothetical protein ACFFMN_12065 [Planobispora siamensis]|uniref:HNH endonuclease n=1 Tax=Planobispora siamensis TaxID=936338 RepID=A0A8J3WHU1_9ACTN|nr:hypothetical protein [Planobispora siamensis]GIH89913.1 hypothetical protein Psi01_05430 [Planobispora siamensis]
MNDPVPAPLAGAALWTVVAAERAGGRCECRGECGNPHRKDGGTCRREQRPGRPLHLAPSTNVSDTKAATLPGDQLMALCPPCHDGLLRTRRRDREQTIRQSAGTDALF